VPYLSITKNINKLLGGGINKRLLTLVYGEGGSGKTHFCLHACNQATEELARHACNKATEEMGQSYNQASAAEPVQGKKDKCNQTSRKACVIDTEGISGELLALCNPERTMVYKTKTFEEQQQAVETAVTEKYSIIVLDSLTNHYRRILSDSNHFQLNDMIAEQLDLLAQYSRLNDCPVLVTTQMTGDRALGGELLDRIPVWIRLEKANPRRLVVERCPLGKEGKLNFRMSSSGIEELS